MVQADEQTAGKGRKNRSWESPPGGLYFSICTGQGPLLPLKGSIAVAEVLDELGVSPKLKWPNDVLVEGKKVCGILVESLEKKAVVGIGLNVESAPLIDSTCLSDLIEGTVQKEDLMKDIIRRFYGQDSVLEAYKRYCSTIGKRVKISTASGEIVGAAVDIDGRGRLVLEGGEKVLSGDVVHLRKDEN